MGVSVRGRPVAIPSGTQGLRNACHFSSPAHYVSLYELKYEFKHQLTPGHYGTPQPGPLLMVVMEFARKLGVYDEVSFSGACPRYST